MTEDQIYQQSMQLLEKFVEFAKEIDASPMAFEVSICLLLKIAIESSSNEAQFINALSRAVHESASVRSTIH